MFMEMSTTITHKIVIGDDGIEGVEHSVSIDGGEFASMVGTETSMIVVKAGLKVALNSVENSKPTVVREED